MDENTREIQELYKKEDEEQIKKERKRIQNKEVFLYKLYKKLT